MAVTDVFELGYLIGSVMKKHLECSRPVYRSLTVSLIKFQWQLLFQVCFKNQTLGFFV